MPKLEYDFCVDQPDLLGALVLAYYQCYKSRFIPQRDGASKYENVEAWPRENRFLLSRSVMIRLDKETKTWVVEEKYWDVLSLERMGSVVYMQNGSLRQYINLPDEEQAKTIMKKFQSVFPKVFKKTQSKKESADIRNSR
jgi:hypothetical protein